MTNSWRILLQPTTWNDVYFRYQNGTLIGRVNNEIKTRPLIGKSSILLLSLAKWFSSSLLIYLLFFLILQSFTPNIEINSASSVLVFGLFFFGFVYVCVFLGFFFCFCCTFCFVLPYNFLKQYLIVLMEIVNWIFSCSFSTWSVYQA